MGAPELPNDIGDNHFPTTHIVQHSPSSTDESDNELLEGGYQPLPMEDYHNDYDINSDYNSRDDSNRITENRNVNEIEAMEVTCVYPNMPPIVTTDVEIEREVWNQPRPRELEIELDVNKTQQILSAMANFQLPNLAVPDWAAGVSEEHWKEELLQRIRQRKSCDDTTKIKLDKESN